MYGVLKCVCVCVLFCFMIGDGHGVGVKRSGGGQEGIRKKNVVIKAGVKGSKKWKKKDGKVRKKHLGKVAKRRLESKGWKRPLLDKRMVESNRLGVGNFNRALDDKLNVKGGNQGAGRDVRGLRLLKNEVRLSSKGGRTMSVSEHNVMAGEKNSRLGRITVYWAKGKGTDRYTRWLQSATGVRLMRGHCAVDPRIIPYGSVVRVHGVGDFWAVDTGSAVRDRKAAKRLGRSREEREAIVVDLFFPTRSEALEMTRRIPRFAMVSWKVLPRRGRSG
jgi:3D (Asp-Asp-Asp) domain-containing protein